MACSVLSGVLLLVLAACGDGAADGGAPPPVDTGAPEGGDTGAPAGGDSAAPGGGDTAPQWIDADGDGWFSEPSGDRPADCDDGEAAINPGADEVCDGVDNDCDGAVDDGDEDLIRQPAWRLDSDGDGYGGETVSERCEAPGPDWVVSDLDCDDGEAAINPGADEVCDGVDNDCDGEADEDEAVDARLWYADVDRDDYGDPSSDPFYACSASSGFVDNDGDCDDRDPEKRPGATWYPDGDSDGFGDGDDPLEACTPPEGYIADGEDCDDGDAAIYPGATETCDATDQDCDDLVDEDAVDPWTWYPDADGDGYGDEGAAVLACETPDADWVGDGGDCNDGDDSINPGAVELWYDGVDQDCAGDNDFDVDRDGYVAEGYEDFADAVAPGTGDCDDDDASISPGAVERCNGLDDNCDGSTDGDDSVDIDAWYQDLDGDTYGGENTLLACEPPGDDWSPRSGDCDDSDEAIFPGADEVIDGLDNDCSGMIDDLVIGDIADVFFSGESAGDYLGASLAGAGDVDGDGYDDLLIGAYEESGGGASSGGAYLISGTESLDTRYDLSDAAAHLTGESADDYAGYGLAGLGDIDGDGYDDVAVGAYFESSAATKAGAAYLLLGPISGDIDLADADYKLTGEAARDYAGFALSGAGDVDGDGDPDLLVGSYGYTGAGSKSGAAYLVLADSLRAGAAKGSTQSLSTADARMLGISSNDGAGVALSGPGDIDGDGYDDVLVGAYRDDTAGSGAGAAYLLLGPLSGDIDLTDADAVLLGEDAGDRAGRAVDGAGDVDGDGTADLLVGAFKQSGASSEAGAAYLVLGSSDLLGEIELADAEARLTGEAAGDQAGYTVCGVGDIDDNSYADLAIGSLYESTQASSSGAVYLFLSPVSGAMSLDEADLKVMGGDSSDYLSSALAGVGDIDGDGQPDLGIGAPGSDSRGSFSGSAYLLLGASLY